MTRKKVREHLFRMLFAIDYHQPEELEDQVSAYLDAMEERLRETGKERPGRIQKIRPELRERFFGVVSHIEEIDRLIGQTSKGWDIKRISKPDVTVLRLAVYEILFDDEIPAGVAIDEGVWLAKQYGTDRSPGFVNGILGTIAREHDGNQPAQQEEG